MGTAGWDATRIPDQRGRTAVVTGGNSGIGAETARLLAARGADVVLACRDALKAQSVAHDIRCAHPEARVHVQALDLASTASIRHAAAALKEDHPRIDLLVNNAGVLAHRRATTADGFELQFGTNHLGHFALTGLLLDRLLATPGSRVVTVTSTGHRIGKIDFDDLHFEGRYRRFAAYTQSKLANLLFAYELQRRLDAAGADTVSTAAHPGNARTQVNRGGPRWYTALTGVLGQVAGQSPADGALPTLRAAVDPEVRGGELYGPGNRTETRGAPVRVGSSARSHDAELQRRLWEVSERLTGISYDLPNP